MSSGALQLVVVDEAMQQQLLGGRREHVLEPRLHQLLNYFLAHPQRILPKTELLDEVWGHEEGSDAALMRAIGLLRKALGDNGKPAVFIETLSKRGYRWIADIHIEQPVLQPQPVAAVQTEPAVTATEAVASSLPQRTATAANQQTRRLMMLALFFACAVIALLASLLLFFKQASPELVFKQQVQLSALPGNEQLAVPVSHDAMLYQQQQADGQWRWVLHETKTHTKKPVSASYQQIGRAQLLGDKVLFQAIHEGLCWFYQLDLQQPEQERQLFACQTLTSHGVLVYQNQLWWLDQDKDGVIQLWRLSGQKPVLLTSFADGYRRPQALGSHRDQVWILLQQDELNSSLFKIDAGDSRVQPVADFPYAFDTVADWDNKHLLLSSEAGVFLFEQRNKALLPFQLPAATYSDVTRQQQRILATASQSQLADLVPLEPVAAQRSAMLLSVSPWLNSNKDDRLLVWSDTQAALMSDRSGLPQIWIFDGMDKVSQLTQFKQWRQISQLFWVGSQLYANIDQQLFAVDVSNGELTAIQKHPQQLRRYAYCDSQWYWIEFSSQRWTLKMLDSASQSPVELRADIVDLRCGPQQSLVLLGRTGQLVQYWPAQQQSRSLPISLRWRELSQDSWQVTSEGIYWLSSPAELQFFAWQNQQISQIQLSNKAPVVALYPGRQNSQLFLLTDQRGESDIVWLQ
jgi:DNA-binding winged helix-turn-helix (wHTH) protein